MTRLRAVVLLAFLGSAVAACDSGPALASPSATAFAESTPVTTVYDLDTTSWYAGLELSFSTATAVFDQYGGTVTIGTGFRNDGPDDQTLDAPVQVVIGSARFDPQHGTVMPDVPAGGTSDVTLTFQIVGQTSVDAATLRVGASDANQVVIPFRHGAVPTVTLQPRSIRVTGTANAADLRLTLRTAVLRWDLPDWSDELPLGQAALTLTYDVTYRGTFSGGLAFTGDAVSLRLPDGSSVGPRRDGHSQSIALLLPGKTQAGLSSRFQVPSGEIGTYVLTLRNGSAKATLKFTISA